MDNFNSKSRYLRTFLAMRWLPILLLLTACSQGDTARIEQTLNQYAQLTQQGDLSTVLSSEALLAAESSRKLMKNLELRQQGAASFTVISASKGAAEGCVDLSEVEIVNAKGELINNPRDVFRFSSSYDSSFLITKLNISDQLC